MSTYNVVAASNESTVVTEYEPQSKRSDAYQSEAALEQAFIKMLEEQGYAKPSPIFLSTITLTLWQTCAVSWRF